MIDFVQNSIDGVMIGASYGLLALGFTLIFGVMRRLNLSYGPSIMAGAYLGTLVYVQFAAGPLVVAAVTVLGAVAAGLYVERLCFAPMAAGAGIASMVSSFAIWMQLEQAATLLLPRHSYPFPALASADPLALGPFLLRIDHVIMLISAVVLAASIQLLLYRSRFGLGLRAIIARPRRRIWSASTSSSPSWERLPSPPRSVASPVISCWRSISRSPPCSACGRRSKA